MSFRLGRLASFASLFALLAACGANDAGTGKGRSAKGGDSSGDPSSEGPDDPGGPGDPGDPGWVDGQPDSGTTIDPDAGCAMTSAESQALPTTVMFQIDLSGSMNCLPTESEAQCDPQKPKTGTRWQILREALKAALDSIPDQTIVGLMHYPTPMAIPGTCIASAVDVPPAPFSAAHKNAIKAKLDQLSPLGGTPTHDAMIAAFTELQKLPKGNKYIVLATDGAAGFCAGCNPPPVFCNLDQDNQQLIASVGDVAQNHNVRSFVIGVPGSEDFRSVLSKMAKAGGTAKPGCGTNDCHYDMTTSAANFGEEIAKVLGEISQQLLSCSYAIPAQDGSFDSNKVNVQLTEDGTTTGIPRDTTKQDGWDYSADGKSVELHGPACEMAKATKQGRIDIIFGCPTILK